MPIERQDLPPSIVIVMKLLMGERQKALAMPRDISRLQLLYFIMDFLDVCFVDVTTTTTTTLTTIEG